jgi:hypothetical protein
MRPLRFIPQGSLVEVSIRTVHGRLLLRPSAATNAAILGILGLAQARYGMVLHQFVVMSNHFHILLSPRDARHLAQFMCFINSNIAREVGRLVDWRERFWSGRYHAIVVSDEPEAQLGRLRYLLEQGMKEGLVAHPFDWPGVSSVRALANGTSLAGTWLDRAAWYRARQRAKDGDPPLNASHFESSYPISIETLPCLAPVDTVQRQVFIRNLIETIVADLATLRAEANCEVLGVQGIKGKDPHSRPRVSRSPAPLFHAVKNEVRRRLREAYALFVVAYREAASLVKLGVDNAVFPEGSFPAARPFVAFTAA